MPTRNRTPHGRAWKPPRHTCSADIRPRGQQGAARRCAAVPESREARSAPGSPRETEAGSSRQKGWTNRGVSPAGRHPLLSRPHHARIVHEPAQPRRSPCATPIEVGGRGPRGMRFGRSPRLRAGEARSGVMSLLSLSPCSFLPACMGAHFAVQRCSAFRGQCCWVVRWVGQVEARMGRPVITPRRSCPLWLWAHYTHKSL